MKGMTAFRLSFPNDLDADQIESFLVGLSAQPRGRVPHIVFSVKASPSEVCWTITADERTATSLVSLLRAHLPAVGVAAIDTKKPTSGNQSETKRRAIELGMSGVRLPFHTDRAQGLAATFLATTETLRSGEDLEMQWVVGPLLPYRLPEVSRTDRRQSFTPTEIARKQVSPVVGAVGRIAVRAHGSSRQLRLMSASLGALNIISRPGVRLRRRFWPSWFVDRRMEGMRPPWFEWPCALNAAELSQLIAWPVGAPVVRGVTYSGTRVLPFAASELRPSRADSARVLGEATYAGRGGLVTLSPKDALQHLHIVGPTGSGKSTVIARLAVQDIEAGRGVILIEPKGDLVDDVLARIPQHRLCDVVVLDPSDIERPVGLNILRASASAELSADSVVFLIKSLNKESWGPRTEDVLNTAVLTLARSPKLTLAELPALLTNERFRRTATSRLADDPQLGEFWTWFNSLSTAERLQVVSPVLNKVRPFAMRASLRRTLGQSEPTFSVNDVFTQRKILLVQLRPGLLGPNVSGLIGSLVVAEVWRATQARSAINADRRHPVMVYVDEFQKFTHLTTDLSDVLAEARSLGVGLTIAHQHLGQLSPSTKAAVLANARSRVVFRTNVEDGAVLANHLGGGLRAPDLQGLPTYGAYVRTVSANGPGSIRTLELPKPLVDPAKVRAISRFRYGLEGAQVEAELYDRRSPGGEAKSGGRRRKST